MIGTQYDHSGRSNNPNYLRVSRREAAAQLEVRRTELLSLAQIEKDVEAIRTGRKRLDPAKGLIALPPPLPTTPPVSVEAEPESDQYIAFEDIAKVVTNKLLSDAIRREINVTRAVLAAEERLKDDGQQPPDRKVDDDWLYRWRDSASEVSSASLQDLWGRLLAGEVKSPGTYSLRTLEFLRNLSREEAEDVAKLACFVILNVIIRGNLKPAFADDTILEKVGVPLDFLLKMQELNVLSGVDALGLSVTWSSQAKDRFLRYFVSNDRVLVVTHSDPKREIQLGVYPVTSVGLQVMQLGKFDSNEEYLRSIGHAIRSLGFDVLLARWDNVSEAEGHFFDAESL